MQYLVSNYVIYIYTGFVFIKYDFVLGEGQEKLSKFKKWFWSMVENMTSKQKQDLVRANATNQQKITRKSCEICSKITIKA